MRWYWPLWLMVSTTPEAIDGIDGYGSTQGKA
ncbi:hypothetical protein Varpa_2721 [Variovorax paradoxus EPS]|uniref:Uncharacterized protein n=1 Tax=Variovorax paradoxus (strain EPS) TaxID=595537 RepID=E6V2U9_VARPE|nr:hypothetical protein Varpa_2721 [Variovorax paradoxus EPS]